MITSMPDTTNNQHIPRFSAAAATYDRHAQIYEQVAQQLFRVLPDIAPPRHLLDAGCGTGLITRACADLFPEARIVGLDQSPAMIHQARSKRPALPRVEWAIGDLRDHWPLVPYDLILSSSTLQWLVPLDQAITHLAAILRPGGWLVVAAMTGRTLEELHRLRAEVAPHKAVTRRLPSHADFIQAIDQSPLTRAHDSTAHYQTDHADAKELFQSLHELGVTGGDLSRGTVPLSRSELTRLVSRYDQVCRQPDGRVPATYEVSFFAAQKEGTS